MGTEREIKIDLVSEERYQRLLHLLGEPLRIVNQINRFFDTDDWALSRAGWALRIRRENDSYTLTLKGRKTLGDDDRVVIRMEHETVLADELAESFIADGLPAESLKKLTSPGIMGDDIEGWFKEKVMFENERRVFAYKSEIGPLELEVDRTIFPDKTTDYELEVEINENDISLIIDELEAYLTKSEIPVVYQSESKFARALKKSGSKPT